ncbi:MBL fold metallo-hydrolase RNA specificity domain-containing protein [Shewanella litorisediminis]|uniref:MBL fold metallo-hydrolase n=1 Tax=Shewanella litorisediminis TaxID=1173586 RepID=A0ABX7G4U5_9GAMM|nr:MBL fold metallo-hydrolase [Shewanella litorisediminis]MCL2917856.1 MBL fold metallo-hydrolase [Shewanella litorisediminis]QRH02293.1 MBL fold metallo-hydrolase [Shewanella litorisediminis]
MSMTLTFWGATEEVTGSCHLLELNGKRLLLDCGLIQGGKQQEARNREPFPFDPASLDAVVLSHAHIDHSGRLPLLVKQGYSGPIYTHSATLDLCGIMLKDAAMLQGRDAERQNKKRLKQGLEPLEALFDEQDVDVAMTRFIPLEYGMRLDPIPGVTLTLRDAGHILGSALLELELDDGQRQKRVVFSGDLGRAGMPILRDPDLVDAADLVLMESTYGNRLHRTWESTLEELKGIFAKAISDSRGNILIPAFSVGRAQELLYLFHLYAKDWDLSRWTICLDSPMAIEATKVYIRHFPLMDEDFKRFVRQHPGNHPLLSNVEFIQSTEESIALNDVHQGLIIIAGSGMCNGGRIRCHLEHNLYRPECDIIICGYQAEGTPGRALVDGVDKLTISGQSIDVRARIHTVGGLSAHADQAELLRWYHHFNGRPPLVLVHGEKEAQEILMATLENEPEPPNAVSAAGYGDQLDLAALPRLSWLYQGKNPG